MKRFAPTGFLFFCLFATRFAPAAEKPLVIDVWPGTPPLFLVHASDDSISEVGHSVIMYLALKRAGVSAGLHVYATGEHGFAVRQVGHPCSTWTRTCADWLRKQGVLERKPRP